MRTLRRTRLIAVATVALSLFGAAFAAWADGADPKTVTPAWVTEQQLAQQQAQQQQPSPETAQVSPLSGNSLFFIGYSYPTLSGPMSPYLTPWNSLVNFSLGVEAFNGGGSSFLTGLELEFFATVNSQGMRLQMNDMMMLGYSIDIAKVARLNLGARLGLGLIDVTDDSSANPSYMLLGGIAGPEASLYGMLAPDFWLWVRGRYLMSYYFKIDSSGGGVNPIDAGDRSLNVLSVEAGIAFKI